MQFDRSEQIIVDKLKQADWQPAGVSTVERGAVYSARFMDDMGVITAFLEKRASLNGFDKLKNYAVSVGVGGKEGSVSLSSSELSKFGIDPVKTQKTQR